MVVKIILHPWHMQERSIQNKSIGEVEKKSETICVALRCNFKLQQGSCQENNKENLPHNINYHKA